MSASYWLLTLLSVSAAAWLGRRLAMARNRHAWGWALSGALFPPVLGILFFLGPAESEADDGEAGDTE